MILEITFLLYPCYFNFGTTLILRLVYVRLVGVTYVKQNFLFVEMSENFDYQKYIYAFKNRLVDGSWKQITRKYVIEIIEKRKIPTKNKKKKQKKSLITHLLMEFMKKRDSTIFYLLRRIIILLDEYFNLSDWEFCSYQSWSDKLFSIMYDMFQADCIIRVRRYGYKTIQKLDIGYTYTTNGPKKLDLDHFQALYEDYGFASNVNTLKRRLQLIGLAAHAFTVLEKY